jgi:hypothetical protein
MSVPHVRVPSAKVIGGIKERASRLRHRGDDEDDAPDADAPEAGAAQA